MKSLTTASIRTHLKRPKVSFRIDREGEEEDSTMENGKENDPLPIVELKPFVQKVWRREKSFVTNVDKCPSVNNDRLDKDRSDAASRTTNGSRFWDLEVVSEYGTEESPPSPPPRTSHSLPTTLNSQRLFTVYANTFDDFRSQKEHLNRLVGESEFKRKAKLHPATDSKSKKQPEHSESIIPGFITRDDRTKTTLLEISEGEAVSRAYNCSPKSLSPDEVRRQQQIRIMGEPLNQARSRGPENTPTPMRGYHFWHAPSIRHGSPASQLSNAKVMKGRRSKRAKTPLYDAIDRSGTLPSLTINAKSLKKRSSRKKTDDADSEDYADYRDVYNQADIESKQRIENSLILLSKHGEPTKVERQLTIELERNLSRFRKSKDYSPFEVNPSEIAKYYLPPTFNMTQGEAYIRQALFSNAPPRHQRKTKSRQRGALAGTMFTSGNQYSHGVLRKTLNGFEHVDSYSHGYVDQSRKIPMYRDYEDEMLGVQDEEINVPYDTPRSYNDTRVTTKQSDHAYSRVQSEPLPRAENTTVSKPNMTKPDDQRAKHATINGSRDNDHTTNVRNQTINVTYANTEEARKKHVKLDTDHSSVTTKDHNDNRDNQTSVENIKPTQHVDMKLPSMRTSQEPNIDASGRTFITSDNIPQVTAVNG